MAPLHVGAGPPRENLAVRFSDQNNGVDPVLRSDSASARDGGRPALESLDPLSSETYWADLPKKERVKWMVDEELAVSAAASEAAPQRCFPYTALRQ